MPRAKAYKPDLDFKRVEKYVRRARALLLPTGWSDWPNGRPPLKHKLPIDDELAQLLSCRKRILSADEVRARHPKVNWPSHGTAVRFQLAWYAEVEFQDSITYAANEAPVETRRLELLGRSEESLAEYFRLTPTDTEMQSAFRKAKAKASANLCVMRPTQGGKPAQSWKAWFVFRLAAFCHIITGEQPSSSPNSAFAELVSAAWNSLHPNIPEIKWETFVRRFTGSESLEEALETAFIASLYAHRIWRP
jgi:hypothetical protein